MTLQFMFVYKPYLLILINPLLEAISCVYSFLKGPHSNR